MKMIGKKLILLLLFIPLVSFGQQFSINELIEISSDIKFYERKMFSVGNQMIEKYSGVWFNYYDSTESRGQRGKQNEYIGIGETISETYKRYPKTKDPKYKLLKRESTHIKFAENYNNKEETASTFYHYTNLINYQDTGFVVEGLEQTISVLYVRENDFYTLTKYIANNKSFEYDKTLMEGGNLVTYYKVISKSNSEFSCSVKHYEDDREGIGGNIIISSYKKNL